LLILRWRRVVILVQYQGDDARQGGFCRANFALSPADAVGPDYYDEHSDALKRDQIALMDRYCAQIYALNPDLLHVLPPRAEFLPYSHISLDEWSPRYCQMEDRPLRIGHAPTHRGVKGTVHLLTAADELRDRGHEFELVLVEGMSNSDAKKVYEQVDILVDQLYAGWYGGLAVELMALGKPVVAYIRQEDLYRIPKAMRADLPIIRAEPSSIADVLESLLTRPRSELVAIGQRSRTYVERWHDPIAIAQRVKDDIEAALSIRP
jgi:glycosyltransferase involved in cell wall biosynthesis